MAIPNYKPYLVPWVPSRSVVLEPIHGAAIALEGVDDVETGNSLTPCMLCVKRKNHQQQVINRKSKKTNTNTHSPV
jgi:hypothetical protein